MIMICCGPPGRRARRRSDRTGPPATCARSSRRDREPRLGHRARERGHQGRRPPRTPPSPRARRCVIAASSRENAGWVRRSFSVADTGPAECRDLVGDGSHWALALRRSLGGGDRCWRGRRGRRLLLRGGLLLGRGFFAVDFFLVDFFAVDFLAPGFFAAARAALAAALAARAAASASTSPAFVTLKSRSSSAPQSQHRSDFGPPQQERPALGTRMVLLRRVAHGAVAVGVAAAAVEHRAEPAALLDQLALLALRAGDAGRDGRVLLDVLAVGVAAASDERTEPAHALLQLLARIRGRARRASRARDARCRPCSGCTCSPGSSCSR